LAKHICFEYSHNTICLRCIVNWKISKERRYSLCNLWFLFLVCFIYFYQCTLYKLLYSSKMPWLSSRKYRIYTCSAEWALVEPLKKRRGFSLYTCTTIGPNILPSSFLDPSYPVFPSRKIYSVAWFLSLIALKTSN
jgi:hypothetical protein